MIKKSIKAVFAALVISQLAGCMGSMGVTQQVADFNVKVTDNKFGRAGAYILFYPAYYLATASDLLVFNSIEFWSGTNPVTGNRAMIEVPYRDMMTEKQVIKAAITKHRQ